MNKQKLFWKKETTDSELHEFLKILEGDYPIFCCDNNCEGDGVFVTFNKFSEDDVIVPGKLSINFSPEKKEAVVSYKTFKDGARAIGNLLSIIDSQYSAPLELKEEIPFSVFGIMLDCSRNAVMQISHLKKWLIRLSLMGYNMVMLYTEDTYELKGEDYFGYMRGPYTFNELKEINEFASKLGIEMIGCIQTLGHMAQVLKWNVYSKIKDTASVMLVDEPETYKLIEKMISFYSEVYPTRRIHVGMDETHDLGRGVYLDKYGFKRGFDIFNDHLNKVVDICKKFNMQPMIWSDMYFRMGSQTHGYYDKKCNIPDDVKKQIPQEVSLVYWDYYHKDEEFYRDWIGRHRDLGFEPVMGSGVQTWSQVWYNHTLTEATVIPCVNACKKEGLKEIFFTMWGDDGGYCDFDSALAGLAFAADYSWDVINNSFQLSTEERFQAICGTEYAPRIKAAEVTYAKYKNDNGDFDYFNTSPLLWDDPILGIWCNEAASTSDNFYPGLIEHFEALEHTLKAYSDDDLCGDMHHAYLLAKTLAQKLRIRHLLLTAYKQKDKNSLLQLKKSVSDIRDIITLLEVSWRKQWMSRNKPFGFEVIQIRLAGLKARYMELEMRLTEYLEQKIPAIPELDESLKERVACGISGCYRQLATGSCIL